MKYMFLLLFCVIVVFAGQEKNIDQIGIGSLFPEPAASVYPDTTVEIDFAFSLDLQHINHNAMRLKNLTEKRKIPGAVRYSADSKTLRFLPGAFLTPGSYELTMAPLKGDGGEQVKPLTYYFDVKPVRVVDLKVTPSVIEVQKDGNTSVSVNVSYSDGTEHNVSGAVDWSSEDPLMIKIGADGTISGIKEGTTILNARYKGLQASGMVTVYVVINGHRLPPDPDPAINNATLLGIDSNGNGVRDDVERRIYIRYPHPLVQAFAIQEARWYQDALADPLAAVEKEVQKRGLWVIYSCRGHLEHSYSMKIPKGHEDYMENITMNTPERMRAYIEFNEALSGDTYSIPLMRDSDVKNCDFDVTKMVELVQ